MTAGPPSALNPNGALAVSSVTTRCTPATCFAAESSRLLSVLPITGGRTMEAYTIPGIRASIPNVPLPVTRSFKSVSGTSLPM